MPPLTVQGKRLHQIGLPYHWGPNGLGRATPPTTSAHLALDPNVHIQEVKALTVRHPARPPAARAGALAAWSSAYQRAGRHHRRDRARR